MVDCWELAPNRFKSRINIDPHYLPNSRQINLLKSSQWSFNLVYLYRRGFIDWSDFVWNLALSGDIRVISNLEKVNWTQLNQLNREAPVSELKDLHTLISALLSMTEDSQLTQSLINQPNLSFLVERFGPLPPPLRLESISPTNLFQPLNWSFLESPLASYLVQISGEDLNQLTLDSLAQLAEEDPIRFNQLISQALSSVTLARRRILEPSVLTTEQFSLLFYDQPSNYPFSSLSPLLQHLDYMTKLKLLSPSELTDLALSIYADQSTDQMEVVGNLLQDLIHTGVNLRTYPLAHFLHLIKYPNQEDQEDPIGKETVLDWLNLLLNTTSDDNLTSRWLFFYFDLTDLVYDIPELSEDQTEDLKQSLIETLVVNEDFLVFDLYEAEIPLQSLFKVLVSARSANFAQSIIDWTSYDPNLLPNQAFQYPAQTQFYSDPCWGEEQHYKPKLVETIFSFLIKLGLVYTHDPLFQRFKRRILAQNQIRLQLLKVDSHIVFNQTQYHLDWLKSVVEADNSYFLSTLKSYLVEQQFELINPHSPFEEWSFKERKESRQLQNRLRSASEQLSQQLAEIDPYVANQIPLITTDLTHSDLLLFYQTLNLSLPFRSNYQNYNRNRLALAVINDLRARLREFPEEKWSISLTINQLINFSLGKQGSLSYLDWLQDYQLAHPDEEIFFDPRGRKLGFGSQIKIIEPFRFAYSSLRKVKSLPQPLAQLQSFVENSSNQQVLDYLKQVNLSSLLITLLDVENYGLVYELLNRIKQNDYLNRRLEQSAPYLLMRLVDYQLTIDYILNQDLSDDYETLTKHGLRVAFYYQIDPHRQIKKVLEAYFQITRYFKKRQNLSTRFLRKLLKGLVKETSLDPEGNLILPSSLSDLEPEYFINSENLRLVGMLSRNLQEIIKLEDLQTHQNQILSHLENYNQALILLSRDRAPDTQYFLDVFNLTNFEDLYQTVPVFMNLVDHSQIQALEALINQIPSEIRSAFLDQARRSFKFNYVSSYTSMFVEPELPYKGCHSDWNAIILSSLILVSQLSSVLRVLIQKYEFRRVDILSYIYKIFQNMVYFQDWEILSIFQQDLGLSQILIESSDGNIFQSYEKNNRTYFEVLMDVLMILGQPDQLKEIESYYSLDSLRSSDLTLNDSLLQAVNPSRFSMIYELFTRWKVKFTKPEDFMLIILAELNQQKEVARSLLNQYQLTNEIEEPEFLYLIACMINQQIPTGSEFYRQYQPYVGTFKLINPEVLFILFRAIIFSGRVSDLSYLAQFLGFRVELLRSRLGQNWFYQLLSTFELIVYPNNPDDDRPQEIKNQISELDLHLRQVVEILVQGWGLDLTDLNQHGQDNYIILLLAINYFPETLLIMERLFNLELGTIDEDDFGLLSNLANDQHYEMLELVLDQFRPQLTPDFQMDLIKMALYQQSSRILKLLRQKLGLTITNLNGIPIYDFNELNVIIGQHATVEILRVLHDDYQLRLLNSLGFQFKLVEAFVEHSKNEELAALAEIFNLNLELIKMHAIDLFKSLIILDDPRITETLRILRDSYQVTTDTLRSFQIDLVTEAIDEGNLIFLRGLNQIFGLSAEYIRDRDNQALIKAVEQGDDQALQILHNLYGLTAQDARSIGAIAIAAEKGYTNILRILHDNYHLRVEDVRVDNNKALRMTAHHGQVKVLQLLHNLYGLRLHHIDFDDAVEVLTRAASQGQDQVLMILHDLYGFTDQHARAQNNEALIMAAHYGYVEILKILHDVYGLTKKDAQARHNQALRETAVWGRTEALQILHDLYGLKAQDARAQDNEALIRSAQLGEVQVLRQLHDLYGLKAQDARARHNEALILATQQGKIEVLRVLRNLYGLTPEDARGSIGRLNLDLVSFRTVDQIENLFGFRPELYVVR